MGKIKQPEHERLRRYRATILVGKEGKIFLISDVAPIGSCMVINEACIVGRMKMIGYWTIPELRERGNTYFADLVATDEMLDYLGIPR